MKGHFFFNTWTMGTMLAELLNAVDQDDDIIILDRGIFDALIWLQIQRSNGQVSQEEHLAFERFVTLQRWRNLIDVVCLLAVDPNTAMQRENPRARKGSVMNPEFLGVFNKTLTGLASRHGKNFSFHQHKNEGSDPWQGVHKILEVIMQEAKRSCDPSIAVVSRSAAERLFGRAAIDWTEAVWDQLKSHVEWKQRSEVEDDPNWVQVLACGIQTHNDKVFLGVRRRPREEVVRERDNTGRIWMGCHLKQPTDGHFETTTLATQLNARLENDFHLGQTDSFSVRAQPLGLIWTPQAAEPDHLGVVFRVGVTANVAEFLHERQIKTNGRGYRVDSSFADPESLVSDSTTKKDYTLEEWSRVILEEKWLVRND